MDLSLLDIVQRFGGKLIGDGERRIGGLAPLDTAGPAQLAFLANPKYATQVAHTHAAGVIVTEAAAAGLSGQVTCTLLVTANPYAYFARVAQVFAAAAEPEVPPGIHPTAQIDPAARIDPAASIGPFVVIEAGAEVAAGVRIDARGYVGRGVRIGANSRLYPGVTIYAGCTVGARAILHAGAVIGSDGFGFAPDFENDQGEWVKIPQVGAVTLGDNVELGANSTIDRGAMADTVIEDSVKIDNQVQIAHNCRIGAFTVIAAGTGIAGSTTLGRHCMIGGAVGIAGHVTLGDHVVVTGLSGVSKSLRKPGVYSSGWPAIDNARWNRDVALLRHLDKMRERLKRLEAVIDATKEDEH